MIGRTAKTGDSWKISVDYPMPDGKKDTVIETFNMGARDVTDGREGVRVHIEKRHDQKALASARAFYFKQLDDSGKDAAQPHVTVTQATEESDDVLDPNTLQSLSSSSTSTIVTQLTGPDAEKIEITEQTDEETSVDYNPGAFTAVPPPQPARG